MDPDPDFSGSDPDYQPIRTQEKKFDLEKKPGSEIQGTGTLVTRSFWLKKCIKNLVTMSPFNNSYQQFLIKLLPSSSSSCGSFSPQLSSAAAVGQLLL